MYFDRFQGREERMFDNLAWIFTECATTVPQKSVASS